MGQEHCSGMTCHELGVYEASNGISMRDIHLFKAGSTVYMQKVVGDSSHLHYAYEQQMLPPCGMYCR